MLAVVVVVVDEEDEDDDCVVPDPFLLGKTGLGGILRVGATGGITRLLTTVTDIS